MRYVWDPAKDVLNRRNHRMSLADGIAALEDPDGQSWLDCRFDYEEERISVWAGTVARFWWLFR